MIYIYIVYHFGMDNNCPKSDIEVADNGMKLIQSFKNFKIKKNKNWRRSMVHIKKSSKIFFKR